MKKTKFLALMSAVCMTFGSVAPSMVMAASTPATNVVSEGAFDITLCDDEIQSNGVTEVIIPFSSMMTKISHHLLLKEIRIKESLL